MIISLIISNFNGKDLLEKNLTFVLSAVNEYKDGEVEIMIVDDCSTDESVKFIEINYPQIKLIVKDKNTGFADSCNLGVEKSSGEIILLLNNDVSPQKDFIKPLVTHFSDEKVFAVGCLEKSQQNEKEVLSGKSVGFLKKGLIWHDRAPDQLTFGPTFWVAGGSGAFRKSIWIKFGGFDPIFTPFYWEDIDLSYRAQKAGYKVLFEPKSIVFHNHESTIGAYFSKKEIEEISVKNQLLFFWKNIRNPLLWIQHLFWLPVHLLKSLFSSDRYFAKGFLYVITKIPVLFRIR